MRCEMVVMGRVLQVRYFIRVRFLEVEQFNRAFGCKMLGFWTQTIRSQGICPRPDTSRTLFRSFRRHRRGQGFLIIQFLEIPLVRFTE